MKSSAFDSFHLSDLEFGVRNHHDQLRRILPVLTVEKSPGEDQIDQINKMLRVTRPTAADTTTSPGSDSAASPGGN
jgi:hypothetical protein